jgi:PPP family 3-phenylpropionic acid transporter
VLIYAVLFAPSNAILDQTTLATLENPGNYGKIRVGGTIGWGIMVLAAGYLIDHLAMGLRIIFYLNIFFNFLFLAIILIMPSAISRESNPQNQASIDKVKKLLFQPGFIPFLLIIVIWGVGDACITGFLFLHIKSLGGSSTLMGTALSVSLVGEIVIFLLARRIQTKVQPYAMVLIAYLILFAWLIGLSFIKNPYAIPLFQIFGGAGYAFMQSGSVSFVHTRASREIGTTAQALRGGVYSGLGVGIGTILSGVLYEKFGSAMLFRQMSYLILAGFILGMFFLYLDKRSKQEKSLP